MRDSTRSRKKCQMTSTFEQEAFEMQVTTYFLQADTLLEASGDYSVQSTDLRRGEFGQQP